MHDDFRGLIASGDVEGVRAALQADRSLANATIRWRLGQDNESDPLHYVSDSFGHGWLTNGREGEIAEALLAAGAKVEGTKKRESPLIGATSLGAENVARVLVAAGADVERTSVFGARALHWAAWVGTPSIVELLLAQGAELEARCTEFGATPLFWAVHGSSPAGPTPKRDQVGAARVLIAAGAQVATANRWGLSALELAKTCESRDMYDLLYPMLDT